jgi:hypothetical protein
MELWIVIIDRDDGFEEPIRFEVLPTKEKAIVVYKEWSRELKEQVDDIGFSGDECLYIAKITDALLPVTVVDEKEVSFHFEWEEFKTKEKQRLGEWIDKSPSIFKICSNCRGNGYDHYNYYPHCGYENYEHKTQSRGM